MPRAVLKVQGAPQTTRWTLTQNAPATPTRNMSPAANGRYNGDGYDSYAEFSPVSQRSNSAAWKPGPHAAHLNGNGFDEVDYNTPLEERASYQISLNTRLRNQNQDSVSKHLLHETALLDTQGFEVLAIDEVDALKKEHERLKSRLEAAQRKLMLESKVRDAAQNLQRLYSGSSKGRADTPQSPDSPRRPRRSLLGQRRTSSTSSEGKTLSQAEDEFASSSRKVDELNNAIKNLLDRRQYVERKLLRHTAAVLAEQKNVQSDGGANGTMDGSRDADDDDASSSYSPDEFDGIRDILVGRPAHSIKKLQKRVTTQKLQEEHEQQLHSMQARLEHLNDQLRSVISEAGRTRGVSIPPEPQYGHADAHDPAEKLNSDFDRLENNLRHLQQEQQDTKTHFARIQDSSHTIRNAVEQQLEGLNTQLHNTLLLSSAASIPDLQEPPPVTGHGYQQQLAYLEESLLNIEHLLRRHVDELQEARESGSNAAREIEEARANAAREIEQARNKAAAHSQRLDEYEATVGGLWEILQSERAGTSRTPSFDASTNAGPPPSPRSPMFESFSLQAFSSSVQHLFDRASSAREQQDILRRQVQQQRDLNGKSDAEKDRQIEELNTKHADLVAAHGTLQEELTKAVAYHTQSESEANQLRAEFMNVENEMEELRRTADMRNQERDELARHFEEHQSSTNNLHQTIEDLEAQISELTDDARMTTVEHDAKLKDADAKHADLTSQLALAVTAREAADTKHASLSKDMEDLESEVVRLTTELTMAKAELDGAYGSRAERAKEAQASELKSLTDAHATALQDLASSRSAHSALESEVLALRSSAQSSSRTQALEQELVALTADFQDLTHESLQLERERTQLDNLIDGLRDRVEMLEGQLSDEKVRWLGVKSPATQAAGVRESVLGREGVSVMVLRQEFKKMMRETRAEGVRLLRTEQEERRRIESELRRLKRGDNGTSYPSSGNHSTTPSRNLNGLTVNGLGSAMHSRGPSTGRSTPV